MQEGKEGRVRLRGSELGLPLYIVERIEEK